MANTYTPKLNLAKPAHGDIDWHIPINQNFDIIDEKLGDIEGTETKLTVKKDIDMSSNDITGAENVSGNNFTSSKVKLIPINSIGTEKAKFTGSLSDIRTITLGTLTIPSEYVTGSVLGIKGWIRYLQWLSIPSYTEVTIKVNNVTVKTYQTSASNNTYNAVRTITIDDYISVTGGDVIVVTLTNGPFNATIDNSSCEIIFYGEDMIPFTTPHPTWS